MKGPRLEVVVERLRFPNKELAEPTLAGLTSLDACLLGTGVESIEVPLNKHEMSGNKLPIRYQVVFPYGKMGDLEFRFSSGSTRSVTVIPQVFLAKRDVAWRGNILFPDEQATLRIICTLRTEGTQPASASTVMQTPEYQTKEKQSNYQVTTLKAAFQGVSRARSQGGKPANVQVSSQGDQSKVKCRSVRSGDIREPKANPRPKNINDSAVTVKAQMETKGGGVVPQVITANERLDDRAQNVRTIDSCEITKLREVICELSGAVSTTKREEEVRERERRLDEREAKMNREKEDIRIYHADLLSKVTDLRLERNQALAELEAKEKLAKVRFTRDSALGEARSVSGTRVIKVDLIKFRGIRSLGGDVTKPIKLILSCGSITTTVMGKGGDVIDLGIESRIFTSTSSEGAIDIDVLQDGVCIAMAAFDLSELEECELMKEAFLGKVFFHETLDPCPYLKMEVTTIALDGEPLKLASLRGQTEAMSIDTVDSLSTLDKCDGKNNDSLPVDSLSALDKCDGKNNDSLPRNVTLQPQRRVASGIRVSGSPETTSLSQGTENVVIEKKKTKGYKERPVPPNSISKRPGRLEIRTWKGAMLKSACRALYMEAGVQKALTFTSPTVQPTGTETTIFNYGFHTVTGDRAKFVVEEYSNKKWQQTAIGILDLSRVLTTPGTYTGRVEMYSIKDVKTKHADLLRPMACMTIDIEL